MVGSAGFIARTSARYDSASLRSAWSVARCSAVAAAASSARSRAISPGTCRTWSWMRLRPFFTIASRVTWLVMISAPGYAAG